MAIVHLLFGALLLPRTVAAQDPVVEHARKVAMDSRGLWTPLGYNTLRAQYSVGWLAAPGAGYALLGAPTLTLSLVTSGGTGVATKISIDALLKIAELAVGSPREAARQVAASQRNEALGDYARAYALGKRLIGGGTLTHEEAIVFLDARWGVLRLATAGGLYSGTLKGASASGRLAKAETRFAVEKLIEQYQLRTLGVSNPLPIGKTAFFMKDLWTILQNSGDGLGGYAPYLEYVAQLARIDEQRQQERSTYGIGGVSPIADQVSPKIGTRTSGRRVLLLLDASSSMAGQKLDEAKSAARQALQRLAENEAVALWHFGGRCALTEDVDFTTDRTQVLAAIDGLAANGGTPLAGMLRQASQIAGEPPAQPGLFVVLLTDGQETCENEQAVLDAAQSLGAALHTTQVTGPGGH